jgi:signal transduction histidine kinase
MRQSDLVLTVRDDGVGVRVNDGPAGIGLANTRARLQSLYGAAASLTIDAAPGGGTTVTIVVPATSDLKAGFAS